MLSATENFSLANKLGQGGFGPVYKGTFPEGAEMAVKRLSSQSKQGLKEFKNEVLLIAKLQHRNLIRLLGYSMKNHEMILLYEYMPNKSLDHFIFVKGRDTNDHPTRVVGTYGYMAPEYALNGFFSIKSDVFSFGVVVLEMISGKRNTGYYHNKEAFSLISYASSFWREQKPLDLLDPALAESCNSIEVLRCTIIGLLCVQENPQDRPTMTGVLGMLGMDIESLPDPKEPAFVSKTRVRSLPSYVSESEINQLTITEVEGR
ncbi:putative protein kinase RLK-Pelle-DLSV family [Helianthus annuus]|nr:putative protein kinase RLK-Pelle-DLSV family [Helianthus annuus]